MIFQEVTQNDIRDIKHLQPDGWPDIVPEFESYIQNRHCYPLKATIGNRIACLGSLMVFGKTGWLAHIIVDKDLRNRGIGTQITERLISDGTRKSVTTLLLIATEMGFPVYEKLGFRIVSEYLYYKREEPWQDFLLSPNIYPYEKSMDRAIFQLDREISGEDRRPILAECLGSSLVYLTENALEGIFMPDLGEGLIIARTPEAGLELMKVKYAKADSAVLPEQNQAGRDFLEQNGFTITAKKRTRMILGKDINWIPENIFSRIGGNYG